MTTNQKLEQVMRDTFDNQKIVIHAAMTANDVEEWDSLSHIELIINIESEFNLKLTVDDIINLKNVGEMITMIDNKLNK